MKRALTLLATLTLVLSMLSMAGCFGSKTNIVYAGFAKSPQELHGAIRIATNEKMPVTIVGDNEHYAKMDLGGMLAVREADLLLLIRKANVSTSD